MIKGVVFAGRGAPLLFGQLLKVDFLHAQQRVTHRRRLDDSGLDITGSGEAGLLSRNYGMRDGQGTEAVGEASGLKARVPALKEMRPAPA